MKFTVCKYEGDLHAEWDSFVNESNGGTLFHRIGFLSYHGHKFAKNEHHLLIKKGDRIHGVMPMAIFEEDGCRVAKSPYGGSYGGPVFKEPLNYLESTDVIEALIGYLDDMRVDQLVMTMPAKCCFKEASDTFLFVMLEKGFSLCNRDVVSVVRLNDPGKPPLHMTSRARNLARKARKARKAHVSGCVKASLDDFWKVLEVTFIKHGSNPTHSYDEWRYLCENHADDVWVDVAYLEGNPVAGIGCVKINSLTNSSFYLCQDPAAQQTQALSMLIYDRLLMSEEEGCRWFDFGTSSVNMIGRENIFRFKESFGAIGQFRETYVTKVRR